MNDNALTHRLRIDKFLFFARFYKTRSGAGRAISDHGARITRNGLTRRIDKPSTTVEIGDILSFTCGRGVIALTIMTMPQRRGPPVEAQACYQLAEGAA